MKRFNNYLFENENELFFVYCETGYADALRVALDVTDKSDGGELEFINSFTDEEAEILDYDTY